MKSYSKIALLVVLVLFLSLTACNLKASKAPSVTKTPTGEVPFPVSTAGPGDVGSFGTQTAIAQTPVNATPQVQISTETPSSGGPVEGEPSATSQAQAQPQQPAAPQVNTPVVTPPPTYALQKGEWPICIARRYSLDIPSFFALNGLNMNSKPAAGTVLKIPSTGNWNPNYGSPALRAHPDNYTVAAGDTINTIACKYGNVTPEAILAVNGLSGPGDIKAGMALKIP